MSAPRETCVDAGAGSGAGADGGSTGAGTPAIAGADAASTATAGAGGGAGAGAGAASSADGSASGSTSAADSAGAEVVMELAVKWGKERYQVPVTADMTVAGFQEALEELTSVPVARQKLLGLPKKAAADATLVGLKGLKPTKKLMLMGKAEPRVQVSDQERKALEPDIDDMDVAEDAELDAKDRPVFLEKIQRRIDTYTPKKFNDLVPGKRTLVLDIDYTLFDHRSVGQNPAELMRPYLHEFLTAAYEHYNIIIWSATSMKWIEAKMTGLGVATNPNYKICMYFDYGAMITVQTPDRGVFNTKPLPVIWGMFPELCTPENTIMFDDIRRNFIMNPENGLKIRPCRQLHLTRETDKELLNLTQYLLAIVEDGVTDMRTLNHRKWERYVRHAKRRRTSSS